jgi:hypothetical protein
MGSTHKGLGQMKLIGRVPCSTTDDAARIGLRRLRAAGRGLAARTEPPEVHHRGHGPPAARTAATLGIACRTAHQSRQPTGGAGAGPRVKVASASGPRPRRSRHGCALGMREEQRSGALGPRIGGETVRRGEGRGARRAAGRVRAGSRASACWWRRLDAC